MATPLVPLHVAPHAKLLAASADGTAEWLLACVAVAVDLEAGRAREGFVAGWADVAVLREGEAGGGGDVVVVLPGVCGRWC
jgi:hypothetical protein